MTEQECLNLANYATFFCLFMILCHVASIILTVGAFSKEDRKRYDWGHNKSMEDTRLKHVLQQENRDRESVYQSSRWYDARVGLVVFSLLGLYCTYGPRYGLLCS